MHLVEEHSVVDPTYIEDFLLTYRTFLSSPMVVGKKLLEWFHDPSLRDKVQAQRILLHMKFTTKYIDQKHDVYSKNTNKALYCTI